MQTLKQEFLTVLDTGKSPCGRGSTTNYSRGADRRTTALDEAKVDVAGE